MVKSCQELRLERARLQTFCTSVPLERVAGSTKVPLKERGATVELGSIPSLDSDDNLGSLITRPDSNEKESVVLNVTTPEAKKGNLRTPAKLKSTQELREERTKLRRSGTVPVASITQPDSNEKERDVFILTTPDAENGDFSGRNLKMPVKLGEPHPFNPLPPLKNVQHGLNGGMMQRSGRDEREKVTWPETDSAVLRGTLDFMKAKNWASWQPNRLSICYSFTDSMLLLPTQKYKTEIVVSSEDALTATLRLCSKGINTFTHIPLLLAEDTYSELEMRTDYLLHMKESRPLYGGNYHFPVSLLRGEAQSYPFLKGTACDPSYFSQIGVLVGREMQDQKGVECLLKAAVASGHRRLVVSNPSLLFKAALETFDGRFEQVIFARGNRSLCAAFGTTMTTEKSDADTSPCFVAQSKRAESFQMIEVDKNTFFVPDTRVSSSSSEERPKSKKTPVKEVETVKRRSSKRNDEREKVEEKPKKKVEAEKPKEKVEVEEPKLKVEVEKPKEKVAVEKPKEKVKVEKPKEKVESGKPKEKVEVEEPKLKVEVEKPKEKVKVEKPKQTVEVEKPKDNVEVKKPKEKPLQIVEKSPRLPKEAEKPLQVSERRSSNRHPSEPRRDKFSDSASYKSSDTRDTTQSSKSSSSKTIFPWSLPQPLEYNPVPPLKNIWHGMNGGIVQNQVKSRSPYFPVRPATPDISKLGAMMKEKAWRVEIAYDTLAFLKARKWETWQPNRANVRYEFPNHYEPPPVGRTYRTKIIVSCEDSFGCAMRLLQSCNSAHYPSLTDIPLVLNMANARARGGGFLHGARAQEEDLCRRSDLFMHLQASEYPLPEFGSNYNFPVCILRDTKHKEYTWLKTSACDPSYFFQIGVVSAAAYNTPSTIDDTWREKMRRKVDNVLFTALATGHRKIVLGSWGCGAFHNPPNEVSEIFAQALDSPDFKNKFKQVIFALGTRHNDRNLDDTAKAFLEAFNTRMWRPGPIDLDPIPTFIFQREAEKPRSPNATPRAIRDDMHIAGTKKRGRFGMDFSSSERKRADNDSDKRSTSSASSEKKSSFQKLKSLVMM